MKIIMDCLKIVVLSLLFMVIFMFKLTRDFFKWLLIIIDHIMTLGDNGLENEMKKLKITIIDLFKNLSKHK